jgi:hypothetical protein
MVGRLSVELDVAQKASRVLSGPLRRSEGWSGAGPPSIQSNGSVRCWTIGAAAMAAQARDERSNYGVRLLQGWPLPGRPMGIAVSRRNCDARAVE